MGSLNDSFMSPIAYTSSSEISPSRACRITPTAIPSGVLPTKSARIFDGAVFRCSWSRSAKSIVGQPQLHVPTTLSSGTCEENCLASALPLDMSHSRRVRSSRVSGLRSGLIKVVIKGNSATTVLRATCHKFRVQREDTNVASQTCKCKHTAHGQKNMSIFVVVLLALLRSVALPPQQDEIWQHVNVSTRTPQLKSITLSPIQLAIIRKALVARVRLDNWPCADGGEPDWVDKVTFDELPISSTEHATLVQAGMGSAPAADKAQTERCGWCNSKLTNSHSLPLRRRTSTDGFIPLSRQPVTASKIWFWAGI